MSPAEPGPKSPAVLALALGAVVGSVLGAWTVGLNYIPIRSSDALIIVCSLSLVAAVPLGVLAFTAQVLGWIAGPRPGIVRGCMASEIGAFTLSTGLVCSQLLGGVSRGSLEYDISPLALVAVAAIVAASVAASWRFARQLSRWVPVLFPLAALGGLALGGVAAGGARAEVRPDAAILDPIPPAPGRNRVVLLAFDGLELSMIEALGRQGRLPAFQRLLDEAAIAQTRTLLPTYSPAIWTTIASGVMPERHGVFEFTTFTFPWLSHSLHRFPPHTGVVRLANALRGLGFARQRPVSGRERRAPVLWELMGSLGLRVAVINWWATWPAEGVNGVLVSDRYFDWMRTGERSRAAGEFVFPAQLHEDLRPLVLLPDEISATAIGEFLAFAREGAPRTPKQVAADGYMVSAFAADRTHARVAEYLLQREPYDFLAVYFRGVDQFSHFAWGDSNFFAGQNGRNPNALVRSYEEADRILASISSVLPRATTLVVCSDHGFGWEPAGPGHSEAPKGLVMFHGPNVGLPRRLPDAHVSDIAPTLMYLLGQPVARDLDGDVIGGAIGHSFLTANAPRYVPTYGGRRAVEALDAPALDAEAIKNLRALGYIR